MENRAASIVPQRNLTPLERRYGESVRCAEPSGQKAVRRGILALWFPAASSKAQPPLPPARG